MEELIWRVLRNRASEDEEARVRAWRRESLSNEQYYRDFGRMLEVARADAWWEVADQRPPSVQNLIQRADSLGSSSLETGSRSGGSPTSRWRGGHASRLLAVVLTIAAGGVGIVLGLELRQRDAPARFHLGTGEIITGASETTTVKLGDGSTVRLAPGSRLLIPEDSDGREVWLDGRAYFAVRHLEGIPFRVRSHAGDALVLGTRFELRASPDRLRVLVVEGTVEINGRETADPGLEVAASQVGQVTPAEPPIREPVDPAALDQELEWMGDFLVFEGTPLREVAAELSRHFHLPFRVLDNRLAGETVRALFFDESVEEVVEVICRALAARCSVQASGVIIGP